MLSSTLYIMLHIRLQGLRFLRPTVKEKMHLQENLFNLCDLDLGVKVTKMFLNTFYIMWPIYLQGFRLLHLIVTEEMHLQENTLFDIWPCCLGRTKCCSVPS